MDYDLSKSKYCKGVQCPKILWMDINMPEVGEDILPESIMATGNKVGDLARSYFGKYDLVEFDFDKNKMAGVTADLMRKGSENIAEAAFYIEGLYCAVDILHRDGDAYEIVEVKSSTKVSDIYIDDMSFQYYVLSKCGIKVSHVKFMHLNSAYVRNGELELDRLFLLEDYTDIVKEKQREVEENIKAIRDYLENKPEPERDIDIFCKKPYDCAYYSYCSRHLPQESIFDVSNLRSKKKYEYYHKGIISFDDIIKMKPKLSAEQIEQVETAYYDRPDHLDKEKIKTFLSIITYPVYHLDFETFQQAIPEYDGISPYMQVVFQYSLHIEQDDGLLEHREFLAKECTDPRRAVAEHLCEDIPKDVCVLAYNMSFERGVLQHLADVFPDLADHLLAIKDNIRDLMIPFQNRFYYCKDMKGSYSIKYVLPALFPNDPELNYHSLEGVHKGDEASAAFTDMVNHTPEEIDIIRKNLLRYCCLDTFAMVKILDKLRQSCK